MSFLVQCDMTLSTTKQNST